MKVVLSLCDRTGVMVQPWLDAGYECWTVDSQHEPGYHEHRTARWIRVGADIRSWDLNAVALRHRRPMIVFAFPPCTHLANSGNRYKAGKGLARLIDGLQLVEACRAICEASDAPWMLENPVGSLSTYWRKPDWTFQPWHYMDNESKRTCLWTGNGFVMPPYENLVRPDDVKENCWKMPPSVERADLRSITPAGFARAVFDANHQRIESARVNKAERWAAEPPTVTR
jgi:hypothetical protein